jgi:hypothetical protein
MAPQLVQFYRTRNAKDISVFLVLYSLSLALTFVYLVYEGATVGWIFMGVELGELTHL